MHRTTRPLLALGALALAGCGAAGPGATAPAPAAPSGPAAGLRGAVAASPTCPTVSEAPPDAPAGVTVPAASVTALRLCPLPLPGEGGGTVDLTGADARLRPLTAALAAPDLAPRAGQNCAAYADLPQTVLAALDDGRWLQVVIPTDECRHYQRQVSSLLAAARGSAGPSPSMQR